MAKPDNTQFFNPVKFSVYRNGAWTTSSTIALVQFDTKLFDTGSNIDIITNKGRFTAPYAGFYFINAMVNVATGSGVPFAAAIYKNGALYKYGTVIEPTVANNAVSVASLMSLAANDFVEIYFIGPAGGTGGVGTGGNSTYFEGFLISTT